MTSLARKRRQGKQALELLEEATQLLRRAPLAAVSAYCTGTFPFALGMLFFWAEMSRGSQAPSRLIEASFLLALLYLWMTWWQALFSARLRGVLTDQPADPGLYPGELLLQGALHPWSFLVLPVALAITLPFGWCFAFFQNVTVLGGEERDLRLLFRRAARQAALWPVQNHVLIALLGLCWLFACANLGVAAYFLPRLLKSLLGIDSLLVRSNTHLLNSTFFFAIAALAWLCLDPLLKAVYLLRCYYGESLQSGADLWRSFQRVKGPGGSALLLLALAGALALAPASGAAAPLARLAATAGAGPAAAVNAAALERSIARTLGEAEFSWRLPRKPVAPEPGRDQGWARQALKLVGSWLVDAGKWLVRQAEKLLALLPHPAPPEQKAGGATPFGDSVLLIMYGVLGLIVAWGAILVRRRYFSGPARQAGAPSAAAPRAPDLSDESVTAAELPWENWQELADRLFASGETRLALRALYLAGIAHLAAQDYLSLARAKSNRDYERELRRRAHALPVLADSFAENVRIFECAWYGLYQLRQEVVQRFVDNYGRMVSHARRD